jgi:hypothetical protein
MRRHPPPAALFVDDRADNVEAAAKLGLGVLHFSGLEAIAQLLGLLVRGRGLKDPAVCPL